VCVQELLKEQLACVQAAAAGGAAQEAAPGRVRGTYERWRTALRGE
jgi:hypothetical protein